MRLASIDQLHFQIGVLVTDALDHLFCLGAPGGLAIVDGDYLALLHARSLERIQQNLGGGRSAGRHIASKCDLCYGAELPACVANCPNEALTFGKPKIDLDAVRGFKNGVVAKLTKGLSSLAKGRKVTVVQGTAQFASPHSLEVQTAEGRKVVSFDHCIIAAGSQPARIPGFPDDPRLMDSTGALELDLPSLVGFKDRSRARAKRTVVQKVNGWIKIEEMLHGQRRIAKDFVSR